MSQQQSHTVATQNMELTTWPSNSAFVKEELKLTVPVDAAFTLMIAFDESKQKCSTTLYHALAHNVDPVWMQGGDTVTVETGYNDKGWRTWLCKIVDNASAPHPKRQEELDEFKDLIEKS